MVKLQNPHGGANAVFDVPIGMFTKCFRSVAVPHDTTLYPKIQPEKRGFQLPNSDRFPTNFAFRLTKHEFNLIIDRKVNKK